MPQHYQNAFAGPNVAQIDRAAHSNALLRNQVERLPQANRAQDLAIQGAEMQLTDAQKKTAAGVLGSRLAAVANSEDPARAYQQLLTGADFQAAGKVLGLPVDQFTFDPQVDTPETIRQQAQDWANVFTGGTSQGVPAALQTFQGMTQGMSPEEVDRARRINLGLESRAGQFRVTDIGGVPTLTGSGPDGRPIAVPVSSLPAEMQAEFGLSQASRAGTESAVTAAIPGQVQARGEAERRVELQNNAPVAFKAAEYAVSQLDRFTEQAKMLRDHPGLQSATGFGGEQLSGIPGTPAADAASIMETLKAQAFISALGAMREASKTGGAVGNVSDAEGGRFENAFVALQQAQSYPQFIRELDRLIELNEDSKRRIQSAYSTEYRGVPNAPAFGQQTEPLVTATGPNGEKLELRNGQWVPASASAAR